MTRNTESGPPRHDGESIFEILGSSSNSLPSSASSQGSSTTTSSATPPSRTSQTFHLFPELPLEIRRMIWNFALPKHFIPIRTIELSSTTKVPIEGTKSVDRTKTSVMLLTSPDELLSSITELVASFDGDLGASSNPGAREKSLNDMLEKRIFRRTHDDLNLVSFDVLASTIISRLSANSQFASSSYQRYISNTSYREGLRLVCRESYHELSRKLESTLVRVFSDEAVVFNDLHKSVTRMTGIPGAGRASTQNRADYFFPSSEGGGLEDKPTAHFARDLEQKKGSLLAPGLKFHPEKCTLLFQGTLNSFFESCISCPTPATGPNLGRTPAYTTTYENIKSLAVEQDPRDLMAVSYAPRNYGARLDGMKELIFILEREKVERKGDGLEWSKDMTGAQAQLEEKTRVMIEGWGYGAPKTVKVMIAREFWSM